MARVVGLDIGTHAVSAAELDISRGGDVTVERFAQVALPRGAVEHGEVVDPAAVASALRRLWRDGRFRTRDVIAGVANQRVVVRQAEVPAMSEEDLRSSLQFQVQDLIPIPAEEANLDFQILGEAAGPEGEPMLRILLVAAQRDMVANAVTALTEANLSPVLLDVAPFALMRSLGDGDGFAEPGTAEAIVSVGAGVTVVVVHEAGLPQFVRILVTGGTAMTDALASDLGIDFEDAEQLKRHGDRSSSDTQVARAGVLVDEQLRPFLEEVRGTLDFFLAQSPTSSISRIVVTGGGSRVEGLVERLGEVMDVPAERGDPLRGLKVGNLGLTEEQLEASRDLMAVAVGLGLAGLPTGAGERRISLLPSEVAVARAERRQLAMVGAGVAAMAAVLVGVWLVRGAQLDEAREEAAAAEAQATELRADIAGLQDVEALQRTVDQRFTVVQTALADDVAWTRLLSEISTVIPNDVWLTTFTGSADTDTLSFSAQGFDHTSAARWLLRLAELRSLGGLWLPSSTKSAVAGTEIVNFTTTAAITPAAQSDRIERLRELG